MIRPDGLTWHPAAAPLFMKRELVLADGAVVPVARLERPQLLLGEDGTPEVLYAACSIRPCGKKNDGSTFNVQIPLATSASSPP